MQFETAVEGGRLRRDVGAEGGVAPVASTDRARAEAQQLLGGQEEQVGGWQRLAGVRVWAPG
jgi:hypothetical protein